MLQIKMLRFDVSEPIVYSNTSVNERNTQHEFKTTEYNNQCFDKLKLH